MERKIFMKIFYDYKIFYKQYWGGPSRYFLSLAKNINELKNEVHVYSPIYVNKYLEIFKKKYPNSVKGSYLKKKIKYSSKLINLYNRFKSSSDLNNNKFDIYHSTYYGDALHNSKKIPLIITVHDLIHEIFTGKKNMKDLDIKEKILNQADHIICVSKNTQNDLIKFYNVDEKKTSVIYHGAANIFVDDLIKEQEVNKIFNPYFLYVGSRHGYKNCGNFLKAYMDSESLKKNFKIVFFGGGNFTYNEKNYFKDLKINNNNIFHVEGDDNVLKNLYLNAEALVYPSLYEGFGMTPIEAMYYGCPVISSETSSLKEIQGDASLKFKPENINEIKECLDKITSSSDLKKKLINSGYNQVKKYSWEKCASETIKVYNLFS